MSQPTEEGFQRRRDANFLLRSDPCLTAVGAPVVLARNPAGYASMGRRRRGRWGVWDKGDTPLNVASTFLKDRHDICIPVEVLAEFIDEDRNLSNSRRCVDLPDTLCSDLSWPGSCLENISAADYTSCYPPETAPLLLRTTGPQNDHLAFLRPRFPTVKEGATGGDCGDASIEEKGSLDLQCGPIRQISTVAPRANTPSKAFARCDYSVTLVETQGSVEHVGRSPSSVSSDGLESFERRVERAQAAEAVALGEVATGRSRSKEDDEKKGAGLVELERLVFSRRLTCAACSPYTPAHSAFLDEEFRLFHWHVNRGAIAHGAGPLPLPPPPPPPHGLENSTFVSFSAKANKAIARRSMNADVALDYGSHPRVLWMAAQHRAYRVDLREKPCPTTLAPTLDPTAYFNFRNRRGGDTERGAGFGGHGDVPKVRALAVGRRSAHEVFVAAGLFLACVDARFPRDVVARWDLPDEMDQLRWLPGFPGEGIAAQDNPGIGTTLSRVLCQHLGERYSELARVPDSVGTGRDIPRSVEDGHENEERSQHHATNAERRARNSPTHHGGDRGASLLYGGTDLDKLRRISIAQMAAKRPLTFSLPATSLGEGETRSGGLIMGVPQPKTGKINRDCPKGSEGGGLMLVYATSVGDVYGQRLEMGRMGGNDDREEDDAATLPVLASYRCPLFAERIQSMLPCGDVSLDPKTAEGLNPGDVSMDHESSSADGERDGSGAAPATSFRPPTDRGRTERHNVQGGEIPVASEQRPDAMAVVDRFPVNAGALRASVERVPEGELCIHSFLTPLTELVKNPQTKIAKRVEREVSSEPSLAPVRERREQDFGDLREFKRELANYLLAPRTSQELLVFCRQKIGLEFPEDPDGGNGGGVGAGNGGDSNRVKPRIDDSAIANDIASAILSWGPPFRSIEATWRAAAAPSGYSVVSPSPTITPRVPLMVLCSGQEVTRGRPSPLLGPGVLGEPLSVDVTVEDVKWLRNRWDSAA